MAYTPKKGATGTLPTSGGANTISDNPSARYITGTDQNVYYMAVTFSYDGVASLDVKGWPAKSPGIAPVTVGYVSTTENFNTNTGTPRDTVSGGYGESTGAGESNLSVAVEVQANKTYYFWYKKKPNSLYEGYVAASVSYTEGKLWTEVNENLGAITSTYTDIVDVGSYKMIHYTVSHNGGGTIRCEINATHETGAYSNSDLQIYFGRSGAFDKRKGEPVSYEDLYPAYGPPQTITDTRFGTPTWHFWIRCRNAESYMKAISVRIIPPGVVWDARQYDDDTTITPSSGKSWTITREDLTNKTVLYIPVIFNSPGEYTITSSSTGITYGYLTNNPRITDEGKPYYSVLAMDEPTQGGFSFVANITSAGTHYLMFRTDTGNQPSNSFTLSITYTGVSSPWILLTSDMGTGVTAQINRYHQYNYDTNSRRRRPYVLCRWTVSFAITGKVKFSFKPSTSSTAVKAIPRGWITSHSNNTNFDGENGFPPSTVTILAQNANTGGSTEIEMEAIVSAGLTYDFWFRLVDGSLVDNLYGYVIIDPPGTTTEWFRDDRTSDTSLTNLSIDVYSKPYHITAQYNVEYVMSFTGSGTLKLSTAGSTPVSGYIGVSDTGFDPQSGIPRSYSNSSVGNPNFTITMNVTAGTTYYLWFKGNDETIDGDITFTLEVPPPSSAVWRSSDRASIINPSGTATDMISMTAGYVYKTLIQFASSGEVSFYSETTSGPGKLVGYLTEADGGINPSTGVPYGTIVASDDSGDGDFEFNHNVHAGRSYYLWVRATSITAHGTITDIVKMISAASDRGFWIWADTGDGYKWYYLTSYLYTERWRQVKAYAATSTGWIDEY